MFRATGLPGWMRFEGNWPATAAPGMPAVAAPEAETQVLGQQLQALQSQIQAIQTRLDELRGSPQGTSE